MPSPPSIEIRKADGGDAGRIAEVLARAFDDDPLVTWMFPDERVRRARLPRFFRTLLRPALALDEVYTTPDVEGAAFWNPPGTFPFGWWTNARVGFAVATMLRGRLPFCSPGLLYFDRHHPTEPHWYLQMLGTDPSAQGRGVGSALLRTVLDRCDEAGARVYLEASKEKNVPFYVRHGFVVSEEMQVPRGPRVWAMWRDPR
jgi:GNAT superfamily N-acetyltransferase